MMRLGTRFPGTSHTPALCPRQLTLSSTTTPAVNAKIHVIDMAFDDSSLIESKIFEHLQAKIDEDAEVREQLKGILQDLEKQVQGTLVEAGETIDSHAKVIQTLAEVASRWPYYKYNNIWSGDVQNSIFVVLLCGYLGGLQSKVDSTRQAGHLLTLEELGAVLNVPVNLKDRDSFHLTVEEYLQAVISLVDELARLAVNSVTLGDHSRPLQISQFIKDVHAGFQILNLKNDSLRRRSDSLKYSLKKVEDVVYDLSLRNLIPKET